MTESDPKRGEAEEQPTVDQPTVNLGRIETEPGTAEGEAITPAEPIAPLPPPVPPASTPARGVGDGPSYPSAPGGPASGPVGPVRPRPPRSAEQIRADIEAQRRELGQSVELLRGKVNEVTDWRGQLRKHRREITIGAAAVGFAVGAAIMLRRRR